MEVVDIEEVKMRFSELVEKAAKGEPFIIARAGKPLLKVSAVEEDSKAKAMKRIGFLDGQCKVPDDLNTMGQAEIEEMFYGKQD